MSVKPVVPRALANRDVDQAIDHYLDEGGERVGLGFIEALEKLIPSLSR